MLTLCHQVYPKPVSLVEVVFQESNSLNVCLHQKKFDKDWRNQSHSAIKYIHVLSDCLMNEYAYNMMVGA